MKSRRHKVQDPTSYLRKKFPTRKPIKIQYADIEYMGLTSETSKYFIITLNRILDPCKLNTIKNHLVFTYAHATLIDTLIHEWAHCVAGWSDDTNSHRLAWGKAYSQIYREYIKFNDKI